MIKDQRSKIKDQRETVWKVETMSAKDKLISAIEELLKHKNLDDITVSEIIDRAGVSRKTFYRNYRDKYDLASAYFEMFFNGSLGRVLEGDSFDDALLGYLAICEERSSIFKNAYSSMDVNGLRSIDINYTRMTYEKYLLARGADINDPEMKFAIEIAVRGGMEMVIQWLVTGMPMDKVQFRDMIKRTLPADLLKYL